MCPPFWGSIISSHYPKHFEVKERKPNDRKGPFSSRDSFSTFCISSCQSIDQLAAFRPVFFTKALGIGDEEEFPSRYLAEHGLEPVHNAALTNRMTSDASWKIRWDKPPSQSLTSVQKFIPRLKAWPLLAMMKGFFCFLRTSSLRSHQA